MRLAAVIIIGLVLMPLSVMAATQGYDVRDNSAQPGMLMSLTQNPGVVEPASNKNASFLTGIYAKQDASAELQPGQIGVENSGEMSTLVSTLDGNIRVGDRIAPSKLKGIGTKAQASSWIVGVAQASFDARSEGAVKTSLKDSSGRSRDAYVGRIPVIVNITYYNSPAENESTDERIPEGIQTLANRLAGKNVSFWGIVLSFLLIITGVVTAGFVVNSSVRGAFLAIARQPLSRAAVLRMLMRAFIVSALVIFSVLLGAWMLLRIL